MKLTVRGKRQGRKVKAAIKKLKADGFKSIKVINTETHPREYVRADNNEIVSNWDIVGE